MAMRTVRFRVRAGHLEPLEPLELAEGSEVEMSMPAVGEAPRAALKPEDFLVRNLGLKSRQLTREDAYDDGI